MDGFLALAGAVDFAGKRAAMFNGEAISVLPKAALSSISAERGEGKAESVAAARRHKLRMRTLIDAIEPARSARSVTRSPRRHRRLGAGAEPLRRCARAHDSRYDVAIVSNVDGVALEGSNGKFDPAATLLGDPHQRPSTTEDDALAPRVRSTGYDRGRRRCR